MCCDGASERPKSCIFYFLVQWPVLYRRSLWTLPYWYVLSPWTSQQQSLYIAILIETISCSCVCSSVRLSGALYSKYLLRANSCFLCIAPIESLWTNVLFFALGLLLSVRFSQVIASHLCLSPESWRASMQGFFDDWKASGAPVLPGGSTSWQWSSFEFPISGDLLTLAL